MALRWALGATPCTERRYLLYREGSGTAAALRSLKNDTRLAMDRCDKYPYEKNNYFGWCKFSQDRSPLDRP